MRRATLDGILETAKIAKEKGGTNNGMFPGSDCGSYRHGCGFQGGEGKEVAVEGKIPFSRKLKWLKNMLWGGAALLAYEHVWHGEVVPWFPFLTAAANPEDTAVMLRESGVEPAVR